jgi:hypothetical protein
MTVLYVALAMVILFAAFAFVGVLLEWRGTER